MGGIDVSAGILGDRDGTRLGSTFCSELGSCPQVFSKRIQHARKVEGQWQRKTMMHDEKVRCIDVKRIKMLQCRERHDEEIDEAKNFVRFEELELHCDVDDVQMSCIWLLSPIGIDRTSIDSFHSSPGKTYLPRSGRGKAVVVRMLRPAIAHAIKHAIHAGQIQLSSTK